MKIKRGFWLAVFAAVIVVGAGIWWVGGRQSAPEESSSSEVQVSNSHPQAATGGEESKTVEASDAEASAAEEKSDEPETDPEEAKVDAFDSLVDKWMESAQREITLEETDEFVRMLHQVPQDRREECLQRALNLVPDENIMLLAGVLLDKSLGKDLVELVFNDILNRSETVKLPILRQVLKDKTHPCYADAAWIVDVTGQGK